MEESFDFPHAATREGVEQREESRGINRFENATANTGFGHAHVIVVVTATSVPHMQVRLDDSGPFARHRRSRCNC